MENEQNSKKNIKKRLAQKTAGKILLIIKNSMPISLFIIGVITLIFFMLIIVTGVFESLTFLSAEECTEKFKINYIDETFGFFNPDKIKQYLELEQKSYPHNTKVNAEVITTVNNVSTRTNELVDFNIEDMTCEYRLYWQLLASIDVISEYSEKEGDNTVINAAKKYLMPEFIYAFDSNIDENGNLINLNNFKYNKIKFIEVEKTIKTYSDGKLINTETKNTKTKYIIPQPYVESIISPFFNITYEFENQILDQSSQKYKDEDTDKVEKYDETGNIIATITIKTVTTILTKTKVEGYAISNVEQTVNSKLEEFINLKCFENRLTKEDRYNIYYFGSQFKDSEEFTENMKNYLSIKEQCKD